MHDGRNFILCTTGNQIFPFVIYTGKGFVPQALMCLLGGAITI